MAGYEEHTFWCIKCGNQGIPKEIEEFKENFAAGAYKEELEESLEIIKKENSVWS